MSSRKKHHSEEGGESPIGFIMFGDLMSQMLCFFILLFVFASKYTSTTTGGTAEEMLKKISKNFQTAVQKKPKEVKKQEQKQQKEIKKEVKPVTEQMKIAQELKNLVVDEKLTEYVNVIVEEKKVRIILRQPILFDSGHAEIKEKARQILSDIGLIIMKTKSPIDIEGHTDNAPIHSEKYDSNWDLSFDRAYSVIKYMVTHVGMSPEKVHAIGYGEYRPIAPNDSPENMSKNRRIEINVLFNESVK